MAKTITRQFLKLFGGTGDSSNFGKFGSGITGSPIHTKVLATIQALSAWDNGLQDAVLGANKAPFLEDMNSLFYVMCYQLSYLLQEGIPEYDASTTYYTGSVVRKPGTFEQYGSLVDSNLGNALPNKTSDSKWQYLNSDFPAGSVQDFAGSAAPTGWLICNGAELSRTTYATLFAAIGTTWGVGNGSTTFNIPDLRGRVTIGAGTGTSLTARTLGVLLGEETHILTTTEIPAHNHTVSITDPGHTHSWNDPGHVHSISDPGHAHGLRRDSTVGSDQYSINVSQGYNNTYPLAGPITLAATTGISVSNHMTGLTFYSATTGISATTANAGSGGSHNNMQPSAVMNKIIKI